MITLLWALILPLPMTTMAQSVIDSHVVKAQSTRSALSTIDEVLARIELTYPLLRATGVERTEARAKILKNFRAWKPTLNNELEGERHQTFNLTKVADLNDTTGGNDTFFNVGHL